MHTPATGRHFSYKLASLSLVDSPTVPRGPASCAPQTHLPVYVQACLMSACACNCLYCMQILLSLLPSGTVQYSSTYRSHREYDPLVQLGIGVSSKAAAKAAPICPEPTPVPGQALEESAVQVYNTMRTRVLGLAQEPAAPPTDASQSAYDMGASVFTRPDYQTGTSGRAMGGDGAAAADEAVRHSDDEAAVDALFGGLHEGQDGTAAADRTSHPGAPNQAHGGGRNDVQGAIPLRYYSQSTPRGGAYEGLALEPSSYADDAIGYEAAGLEGEETPEEEGEDEEMLVNVKAKLLVACDGPFSEIRQRVLGDGLPTFDVSCGLSVFFSLIVMVMFRHCACRTRWWWAIGANGPARLKPACHSRQMLMLTCTRLGDAQPPDMAVHESAVLSSSHPHLWINSTLWAVHPLCPTRRAWSSGLAACPVTTYLLCRWTITQCGWPPASPSYATHWRGATWDG